MPTPRLTDLPGTVLRLIERHSGTVTGAETVSAGRNSAIAALVRTPERDLFVKGLPLDHPRVWTQKREADVAPYVQEVAPRLHWHAESDGWSLLGFERIEGEHADYTPGSADVAAVMAAMTRLADIPAPGLELKSMPHRLRTYVDDPADLAWFAGDALLHTEWTPRNALVTSNGARFVDWGWVSTGAAWIEPALWLLWLIAHGHTCEEAEREAAAHPAWEDAPGEGLNALARAQRRLWDSIAAAGADEWVRPVQRAARAWDNHRNPA